MSYGLQQDSATLKRWQRAAKLLRELEDDRFLRRDLAQQAGMLAHILELGGEPRTIGFIVIDCEA